MTCSGFPGFIIGYSPIDFFGDRQYLDSYIRGSPLRPKLQLGAVIQGPALNSKGFLGGLKELIARIAKSLVEHPEAIEVTEIEGTQSVVLELRTHPDDLGKVIGREGRTAKALRLLLGAAGMKFHKRFTLEIVEDKSRRATN